VTLNHEIQQLLASFNVPEDVTRAFAEANSDVTDKGIAPGIAVGERAPDLELADSAGRLIRLSDQLDRGPAVISFFRGAWCPVCNLQLAAFHRALPEIKELGATILAIHPDSGELLAEPPDGFFILSDPDQAVIKSYKLQYTVPPNLQRIYPGLYGIEVATQNVDGSWSLPVPGTFIVGQDGIVRRQHVRADFTQRMEPVDVIDALRALGSPPTAG
jgi:peroxiredoxin